MVKSISRIMVTAAAAGLVFAPIAAQANTRAGDSTPVYSASAQPGLERAQDGEDIRGGAGTILLLLLAAAAAVAGIIAVTDNDDNGQSPGT